MLENEGVKPETLKAIESWIQISIRNRKELGENTTLDKILSELVLKFGLEVVDVYKRQIKEQIKK